MPVRILVTEGRTADCTQAEAFIEGINAQCLLADKGDDSDAVLDMENGQTIQAVIPAKKKGKEQRFYDQEIPSCILSDGEASPRDTPKTAPPFLQPPKYAVLPFGSISRNDTI
ncbi:hypothetical protein HCUR_00502 [Holospora curviuscula]|uniref:Transposase IS4-like domain-containing protein n=1 Tax=Holospora curviuscula TaxID=1082868 RepID=A0A2S5R9I8_9PROT|nr:hypothetical protein HCUR_00502 [Holospora curviuscula]